MGFAKHFKKAKDKATSAPSRPSKPAPTQDEDFEAGSDGANRALAGRGPGDVGLTSGRISSSDEETLSEDSDVGTLSEAQLSAADELANEKEAAFAKEKEAAYQASNQETLAEIRAGTTKPKKSSYGKTKTLPEMAVALRKAITPVEMLLVLKERGTLFKLLNALDKFAATKHPELQLPIAEVIIEHAQAYLDKPRPKITKSAQARLNLAQDIVPLAQVHISRIEAQALYAEGMNAPQDSEQGFEHLVEGWHVLNHSADWGAGPQAGEKPAEGGGRAASASAGLSEAEVLAIRAYTASNYSYTNAAVSGWEAGLANRAATVEGFDALTPDQQAASLKKMKVEGATHAGVAMSGLRKLPAWTGTTYRGENVSLERMKMLYTKGKTTTNVAFMSTSKKNGIAYSFAGSSDGPVTVVLELDLAGTGARDVSMLSVHEGEAEVLVLPGAKLTTLNIEEYDPFTKVRRPIEGAPDGKPRANGRPAVYIVTIVQTG